MQCNAMQCMDACMYVWMDVCMDVCMHVYYWNGIEWAVYVSTWPLMPLIICFGAVRQSDPRAPSIRASCSPKHLQVPGWDIQRSALMFCSLPHSWYGHRAPRWLRRFPGRTKTTWQYGRGWKPQRNRVLSWRSAMSLEPSPM